MPQHYTIVSIEIDVESAKTLRGAKSKINKLKRSTDVIERIESAINRQLKPFGLIASGFTIDNEVYDDYGKGASIDD